jgi:hypothetical protein
MIETLRSLIPDFSHFEEFELRDHHGIAGYQTVLILTSGYPFAGGTHENKIVARQICAAEAIERAHVRMARESTEQGNDPLLLVEIPTSCGFAAGFESQPTIFRAVCEAVERWCWSKWIDEGYSPARVEVKTETRLGLYFSLEFDSVHWFRSSVKISGKMLPDFIPRSLIFSAAICAKNGGIFPGSRVSTEVDDLITHPLLEAWRHRAIYNIELQDQTPADIIDKRIKYYGKNGEATLSRLLTNKVNPPPSCQIRLISNVAKSKTYEVWRSLADDYIPWHEGDEKRFVY